MYFWDSFVLGLGIALLFGIVIYAVILLVLCSTRKRRHGRGRPVPPLHRPPHARTYERPPTTRRPPRYDVRTPPPAQTSDEEVVTILIPEGINPADLGLPGLRHATPQEEQRINQELAFTSATLDHLLRPSTPRPKRREQEDFGIPLQDIQLRAYDQTHPKQSHYGSHSPPVTRSVGVVRSTQTSIPPPPPPPPPPSVTRSIGLVSPTRSPRQSPREPPALAASPGLMEELNARLASRRLEGIEEETSGTNSLELARNEAAQGSENRE